MSSLIALIEHREYVPFFPTSANEIPRLRHVVCFVTAITLPSSYLIRNSAPL